MFNASDFFYVDHVRCLECAWIFSDSFESFLFWFEFFIHDDHIWALKLPWISFDHEMLLVIDFDVRPFGMCQDVIKVDSC